MCGSARPHVSRSPARDSELQREDQTIEVTEKETLVRSLIETVTADSTLVAVELELLRAVCAMLHVPVPIIAAGDSSSPPV